MIYAKTRKMILDFSVGNYRSFNKVQTLNLRATSLVSENKSIDQNNVNSIGENRILKSVGIYGPNGSGKSNLLRGLVVFKRLVERSLESETVMRGAPDPFKLTIADLDNFGYFQLQVLLDNKKYRYGFTLNKMGNVKQEWLFGPAEKNETWYFKRTANEVKSNGEWFVEGEALPYDNLRSNTLFLTFASAYNGELSQKIRNYVSWRMFFENVAGRRHLINSEKDVMSMSPQRKTNKLVVEGKSDVVLDWLQKAGLFYSSINIEDRGVIEQVLLEKKIINSAGETIGKVVLDLERNESAGTRKFYSFIGLLYDLFENGGVFISDEIDNNFHPSLLKEFVAIFHNPEINKAGAQLIFTSHDTNLLQPDILRRDQIYFTEKSMCDESILYSLGDLKGIRNNADFARQYLAGYYGALPILEKFKI